jgi:hypothetical protein
MKNRGKTAAILTWILSLLLLFAGCRPAQETKGNTTATVGTESFKETTTKETTGVPETSKEETKKEVRLIAYKEGELYGYKDSENNTVIKPQFSYAEDFEGNRGIVRIPNPDEDSYGLLNEGLFGLIDPEGNYVIPPEGIILRAGKYRYLTSEPKELFPQYGPSGWNMIKYRFTDENGNHLTEPEFYDAKEITEDLFVANNGRYTLFIDSKGQYIENSPVFRFYADVSVKDGNIVLKPYEGMNDRIVITVSPEGKVIDQYMGEEKISDSLFYTTEIYSPYIGTSYFYPVFHGDDNALADELNQSMANILDGIIGDESALDTPLHGDPPAAEITRTLSVSYGIQTVNNILNLDFEGYWYGFGAAHPNSYILSYYLDKTTGKQYRLEDLFKEDTDWRMAIAKLVNQVFLETPDIFLYIGDDAPEEERLEEFYREEYYAAVTADGLKIYYQQYDIAPYAAGFPTALIPYDKLSNYMNKESDFYKSLFTE